MTEFFTPPELVKMGRGSAGYFDAINRQLATLQAQVAALGGLTPEPETPVVTSTTVPPLYKSGLITRRDSGTSITVLPGAAAPSTGGGEPITIGDARTKLLTPYSSGNGAGGLTTALASGTWYHIFVGAGEETDVFFDTSPTSPVLPTGISRYRRIGSFLTNGSSEVTPYLQSHNRFVWETMLLDFNATTAGTVALRTLTVPDGIIVGAYLYAGINIISPGTAQAGILSSPSLSAVTPTLSLFNISALLSEQGRTYMTVDTNTSRQIRSELTANNAQTQLVIMTLGWTDYFGETI